MKTLRFLHTADWHSDSDSKKQAKLEASLKQIVDYCKEIKVNAIIIAGDVWERSQKYQQNSGVPLVQKCLRELAEHVDFIFITKGNSSHDEPGSIQLLHQLESNIYAFEYPVCLGCREDTVVDLMRGLPHPDLTIDYIISLVPYPTKASLLIEDSIDNNNAEFIQKFEGIFEHIGEVTQSYTCPKLLAFHGNVIGSRLSSGQTLVSQDIMVAPSTLEKAYQHYYALGHIHCPQMIKENMYYSGSIYNKNWGEVEQKGFLIIDFADGNMNVTPEKLTAAKAMIKVEADFRDGEFWFDMVNDELGNANFSNAEYRVRIKIAENERNLITDEKINDLKKQFNDDVKIEFNIVPVERESRSEQIMNCHTLLDEVKEYAAVTEQPINGAIEKKVAEMIEKGVAI